jgi:hypothetical protein
MTKMVRLPAFRKPVSNGRRSYRRHFRGEERAALRRAETGAELYRKANGNLSLQQAADRSGSCVAYLRAALVFHEAINNNWISSTWIGQVRRGEVGVLLAAKALEPVVALLKAFKNANPFALKTFYRVTGMAKNDLTTVLLSSTPEQRAKAAWALGLETVWQQMVEPLTREVKAAE